MTRKMNERVVALILIGAAALFATARAIGNDEQFTCSADPVALGANESTTLHVWHAQSRTLNVPANWRVDAGEVYAEDGSTRWRVGPVTPGAYQARLVLDGADACVLRVIVAPRRLLLRGGRRETGSGFLVAGAKEPEGYGLYSYVLLGGRPDENNRDRYLAVITAILKIEPVDTLSRYVPKEELNNTLIPITRRFPQYHAVRMAEGGEAAFKEAANWVLNKYDYARARALLRRIAGETLLGPYILSAQKPAGLGDLDPEKILFQDFSTVPDDLIVHWVREFQSQAQQVRFWDVANIRSFALRLRTTIGILASSVETVESAGRKLLEWKKEFIDVK